MFHICIANQAAVGVSDCPLLMAAYILAGLAMMLNIRLSYSSAPYALIRFKLPENLFSVFVRRMASALELWCLPSMLLGNIMDLIQKLAIDTDPELRIAAGASSPDGLVQMATQLHDRANELDQAVKNVGNDEGAKVLKYKAGTEAQNDDPKHLRKLAKDLHNAATQLESVAPGDSTSDNDALKLKAGTSEDDGLRKLAKTLYEAAKALVDTRPSDNNAAQQLADAVGQDENTTDKLRQALQQLAGADGDLIAKAGAVRDAYDKSGGDGVKPKFTAVQGQEGKYDGDKQPLYEAVKKAWEAFNDLYTANLKKLANDLKDAIGTTGQPSKLQQTLSELGNDTGDDPSTKANAVKTAYEGSTDNGVKPKFDALKAKEFAYQAIAAIKSLYENVVKAMTAFDNVYKPEELLKDAVGNSDQAPIPPGSDPKTLREALHELGSAGTSDPTLHAKAKAVKDKYSEGWSDTIKQKFHLVQAQANAYEQGNTIKTEKYKNLLDAWTAFNDKYYKVISSPKYNTIIIPSIITQWLNFLTYVILLIVYVVGGDQGHLTVFYFVIAISGVVFGINMTLVYSVDFNYIPVYIVGENCFPIVTSFIHYITTLMFGNRRKWNSDFIVVYVDIVVAIIISLVAAVVWTYSYVCKIKYGSATDKDASGWHHIFSHGFSGEFNPEVISPFLMIVVGMGLVYAIYPGIAPGMIVPFYLIDKIEMVLLIATFFPPVIVAALRRSFAYGDPRSPMCKWDSAGFLGFMGSGLHWHAFDLLMVIKISLAVIFIYSLHYRESNISRSIINQPKMSTFLSITFYMCHECLLALGFPGLVGANGGGDYVLIPQYIGALFMIFLAFYSEGYIIEYKSHDPQHWPTEGMTKWNAFCYWYYLVIISSYGYVFHHGFYYDKV
ncbi:Tpr-related protein family member, putative [Theileria annulata]|uniref:Tpr-related protein family member, putative n=1 Tax=Theileria annulata TaxID=5874 RepID=Q4UI57_THEAN|nr:Tpr-related protein family member, putative [Theileria annulata]CAI73232.1 Tpr-related protein family member, putative [Theileria annulata]|eukprot:XP_953909.1 Tpr-related protein family member, putative [Theileria annulata]